MTLDRAIEDGGRSPTQEEATGGQDGSTPRWRDLGALFEPRSVAIVGASNDRAKWGNWLTKRAVLGEHRRAVYLVNRNGGEIVGRPSYRSLGEAPDPVDLAVIAVPAAGFEDAVDEALAKGVRAIVGISAGLGERGAEGRAREQAVAARVRAAGAVLLGPNCLGVFDAGAELDLTSNGFPPGSIGLISQSGNLALELALLAQEAGLGFSRFVSLGNQADLKVAEVVAACAEHEQTRIIALYCEDFQDGRAFAEAAAGAVARGKPVLLITVGGSDASARAARSHTGALASASAAIDAACRAAGIDRVATPQQLVDLALGLLGPSHPRGRRTAILADGGGHGTIAAEIGPRLGVAVPAFSDKLATELRDGLPATASTVNPIDLAGGGEQDVSSFARVTRRLLAADEVDAVLMTGYFGGYAEYGEALGAQELETAREIGRAVAAADKPLIVHTMHARTPAAGLLRAAGIPVYHTIDAATAVLARLLERAEQPEPAVPRIPPPAAPVTEEGYGPARRLIAAAGIPLVQPRQVRTLDQARAAAAELGYPLVLKALGSEHKSDAGGVALGLADEAAFTAAFERMCERLAPPAYSVEQMARLSDGVELLIGARRDPRFGAIALVGIGGVFTEVLADIAVGLAPLDRPQAEDMIHSLRGLPLLRGARGRPPVDIAAATEALARLSYLAAQHPEIAEIEVNPLLACPDGVVALDARIVLGEA